VNENGEMNKPSSDDLVDKFILGKFREAEVEVLKNISDKIMDAIKTIIIEGKERAMTKFN
jgi:peptidyl-tRNA hydrolase